MSKVTEIAKAEIGYKESPANTNRTKYGEWFGFDGVAWCGMFVSWVYAMANKPLGNVGFLKGFAGCMTAVDYYKQNKKNTTTPSEGDIVFFDWNADGRYDHTGIFVRWLGNGEFETVEGNTSLTNQSNGGAVMLRKRLNINVLFVHP